MGARERVRVLRALAENPPKTLAEKRIAVDQLRRVGYKVVCACRVVGIATSSYYHHPCEVEGEDALLAKLEELRTSAPRSGYRELTKRARAQGIQVNHKRVYRICQRAGWLRIPHKLLDSNQGG